MYSLIVYPVYYLINGVKSAHEDLNRQLSHNTRTVKMSIPRLDTSFCCYIPFPQSRGLLAKWFDYIFIVYCHESPLLHSLQFLCRLCTDCIFILIYFSYIYITTRPLTVVSFCSQPGRQNEFPESHKCIEMDQNKKQ